MDNRISYYNEFRCTGDKCPTTCCQQWKIAVDKMTETRWKKVQAPESYKPLSSYVVTREGQRVIRLDNDNRCPFLQKDGLCQLVCLHGEDMLSNTCHIFPRQINEYGDYKEYTLTACCPEVIDIINRQESIELENCVLEADGYMAVRQVILNILRNEGYSINTAMMTGFYVLLDIRERGMAVLDEYKEQTGIERIIKAIEQMSFDKRASFSECNELFLDMVENYRRQRLYGAFLTPLCGLAEELAADEEDIKVPIGATEALKEYEPLLRKYLQAEVITSLYLEDYDLENMIIAMQWIGMEYAAVRHALILTHMQGKELTYERVRECIVITARMTGYDEEDIREYMINSFEAPVWEWGYMALLMGKE